MSLIGCIGSRFTALGSPEGYPTFEQFEQFIGHDLEVPELDVQTHNNPLRAIIEEGISQLSDSPSSEQPAGPTSEPSAENNTPDRSNDEQREESEPEPASSAQENSSNAVETNNVPVANVDVVIG